jgi:hypothetical protein
MVSFMTGRILIIALLCLAGDIGAAEEGEDDLLKPWVDYRNGAISVAFSQVPVEFAVTAIHARTGVQIVVPRQAYGKTINLRLRDLPLESAMRSLIFSIGFTSFALTYDRSGRPVRAIILEAPPPAAEGPAEEPKPLTDDEKESLIASLKVWDDLNDGARERIASRLRSLPPSEERDELIREYGRRSLRLKD